MTFELLFCADPPPEIRDFEVLYRRADQGSAAPATWVPLQQDRGSGNSYCRPRPGRRFVFPLHVSVIYDWKSETSSRVHPFWGGCGRWQAMGRVTLDGPVTELCSSVVEFEVIDPLPQDEEAWIAVQELHVLDQRPGERVAVEPAALDRFLEEHGMSVYAPFVMLERVRIGLESKQEGYDLLRRILAEHPSFSAADEVQYYLGVFCLELERRAEAAEHFRLVEQWYPNSTWATKARKEARGMAIVDWLRQKMEEEAAQEGQR